MIVKYEVIEIERKITKISKIPSQRTTLQRETKKKTYHGKERRLFKKDTRRRRKEEEICSTHVGIFRKGHRETAIQKG